MISFPHAKINLGLHIVERRKDGFHNLETCFYPIKAVQDSLEMIPVPNGMGNLSVYGSSWNEPKEMNLIWKAWLKFREVEPYCPEFHWHLLKKIPLGGGLGGGSSDAAFALRMMATFCKWELSDIRLQNLAAEIGSDCAYFLQDKPMFGTGRGEVLKSITVDLSQYWIELITPGIHVSTSEAFSKVVPAKTSKPIPEILKQPVETWKMELVNDFEKSVFSQFPALKKMKEDLYEKGATYASLSGSGSSLFGIFKLPSPL